MLLSVVLARRASGVVEGWGRLPAGSEETPGTAAAAAAAGTATAGTAMAGTAMAGTAAAGTVAATELAEVSGIPSWFASRG